MNGKPKPIDSDVIQASLDPGFSEQSFSPFLIHGQRNIGVYFKFEQSLFDAGHCDEAPLWEWNHNHMNAIVTLE